MNRVIHTTFYIDRTSYLKLRTPFNSWWVKNASILTLFRVNSRAAAVHGFCRPHQSVPRSLCQLALSPAPLITNIKCQTSGHAGIGEEVRSSWEVAHCGWSALVSLVSTWGGWDISLRIRFPSTGLEGNFGSFSTFPKGLLFVYF